MQATTIRNEAFEPLVTVLADIMKQFAEGDIENSVFGKGIEFLKERILIFSKDLDYTLGKMGIIIRDSSEIAREIENIEKGLGKSGKKTDILSSALFRAELPKLREELAKSIAYEKKLQEQQEATAKSKEESEKKSKELAKKKANEEAEVKKKAAQAVADAEKKAREEKAWADLIAYHQWKALTDEYVKTNEAMYQQIMSTPMPYIGMPQNKNAGGGLSDASLIPQLSKPAKGGLSFQAGESSELTPAEIAENEMAKQQAMKEAKVNGMMEIAQATVDIGTMIADAALASDQREIDSYRAKEQTKIDGMNVSGRKKAQMQKALDAETLKRETELAKKRGKMQIVETWANAAASSAMAFASLIANGAKGGGIGVAAAMVTAGITTGIIMANATAQTAIIASQMNGYASGGVVGGRNQRASNGPDNTSGTLRTGERVLNAAQQTRLDNVLFGGGGASGGVTINIGELTGDKLQELEEMLLKLRSYGRI
jgi:hypothetical protein